MELPIELEGVEQLAELTGDLSDDKAFAQLQHKFVENFTPWQKQILNMHRFDEIPVAHSSVVRRQSDPTGKSVSI